MKQLVKVKEVIVEFRNGGSVKFAGIEKKVKLAKAAVALEYPGCRWLALITDHGTWYFAAWRGRVVARMTLVVEVLCGSASNGA